MSALPDQIQLANRARNALLMARLEPGGAEALADVLEEIATQWRNRGAELVAANRRGAKGTDEKLQYAASELAGIAVSLRKDGASDAPAAAPAAVKSWPTDAQVRENHRQLNQMDNPDAPPCGWPETISGAKCALAPHPLGTAHEGNGMRWADNRRPEDLPAPNDNDVPLNPCQPIGCDNGIHLPGCIYAGADQASSTAELDAVLADTIAKGFDLPTGIVTAGSDFFLNGCTCTPPPAGDGPQQDCPRHGDDPCFCRTTVKEYCQSLRCCGGSEVQREAEPSPRAELRAAGAYDDLAVQRAIVTTIQRDHAFVGTRDYCERWSDETTSEDPSSDTGVITMRSQCGYPREAHSDAFSLAVLVEHGDVIEKGLSDRVEIMKDGTMEITSADPFSAPDPPKATWWTPVPTNPVPWDGYGNQPPAGIHQSAIKTGEACGLQLRLIDVDQVPQVPTWANVAGTALHSCYEMIERTRLAQVGILDGVASPTAVTAIMTRDIRSCRYLFDTYFDLAIAEAEQAAGPDLPQELWRTSNKGIETPDWWRENAPGMLQDYIVWSNERHAAGWQIFQTPKGPMLEFEFQYPIPYSRFTDVYAEGRIDQVWMRVIPEGIELQVIDPKSGKDLPKDDFQLAYYARAVRRMTGDQIEVSAAYYDSRSGKTTDPIIPKQLISDAEIDYRAGQVAAMHLGSVYPANPGTEYGKPCGICPVRYACPIMALKS